MCRRGRCIRGGRGGKERKREITIGEEKEMDKSRKENGTEKRKKNVCKRGG